MPSIASGRVISDVHRLHARPQPRVRPSGNCLDSLRFLDVIFLQIEIYTSLETPEFTESHLTE